MKLPIIVTVGLAAASCATTDGSAGEQASQLQSSASVEMAAISESQTDPNAVPEDESDPDRMVCRTERVTGQLRRERICRTARRWAEMREAGQARIHGRQSAQYFGVDERPH